MLHGVTVHVEQMHDRCWWIGISAEGSSNAGWSGNFVADSRGRMRFMQQDNDGIAWDEDKEHGDA